MFNRKTSIPLISYTTTISQRRTEEHRSRPASNTLRQSVPNKLLTRRFLSPLITLTVVLLFFLYWSEQLSSASKLSRDGLTIMKKKYEVGLKGFHLPVSFRAKKIRIETNWKGVGAEIELGASLESRLVDWENSPLKGIEVSDYVIEGLKVRTASVFYTSSKRDRGEGGS